MANLESLHARFPTTVLGEIYTRRMDHELSIPQKFKLVGAQAILEFWEDINPAEVATECGTSEANLYKHIDTAIEKELLDQGLDTLTGLYAQRNAALWKVAVELVRDSPASFTSNSSEWSHAYGAIANPSSVVNAALYLPRKADSIVDTHTGMISSHLRLLGHANGNEVPITIGGDIFPMVAAYERNGKRDLGNYTAALVTQLLSSENQ